MRIAAFECSAPTSRVVHLRQGVWARRLIDTGLAHYPNPIDVKREGLAVTFIGKLVEVPWLPFVIVAIVVVIAWRFLRR